MKAPTTDTVESPRPPARRRRWWRLWAGAAAVILILAIAITWIVPTVVERQLNGLAARYLTGLRIKFARTQWVFPWQACIVGVQADAAGQDGLVLSLERVCVDLGSLFGANEHLTISQVAVEHGSVHLDRLLAGQPSSATTRPTTDASQSRPAEREPSTPPVRVEQIVVADVLLHTGQLIPEAELDVRVVRGAMTHGPAGPWTYRIGDCRLELPGGQVRVTGEVDLAEPTASRLEVSWRDLELDGRLVRAPATVQRVTCTGQARVQWPQPTQPWPTIDVTADRLTAHPPADGPQPLVARDVHLTAQPSAEQAGRLEIALERMKLAGGQVHGGLTYEPADGGRVNGRGELESVRLEPIYRLLLPTNQPLIAVATGTLRFEAAVAGESSWSAGGQMDLTDAELARLPLMKVVLDHLQARKLVDKINPLAFRNAHVQFGVEPEGIDLTQTQVRSPAVALYFEGRIGWEQQLDLMVTAGVIPGLRKRLPDVIRVADEWLSRMLRDNLVPLRVTGTMKRPVVVPLPGGKLTQQSVQFFKDIVGQGQGE